MVYIVLHIHYVVLVRNSNTMVHVPMHALVWLVSVPKVITYTVGIWKECVRNVFFLLQGSANRCLIDTYQRQ